MAAGERMTTARAATILLLLVVAACAPRQLPQLPPPPVVAPSGDLRLWPNRDAIQSACLNDLAATGAEFELIAQAQPGKGGCTLVNGVRLIRTGVPLNRPVEVTCPLALRLMQFEREVMQPEALRVFGKPLGSINHAGGFNCKRMTGNGARISEHGHGRAIDIWGFTLADGTRISIADHFRARGREGDFLRQVSRQACRYFSVVLGPNADASHAKHFHWDISQWKRCGA